MNEKIPRTPFSTHLSGSAKEAERRIRNIFIPRRKPPVPLVVLVCALCLLSGNLVSCQMAEPSDISGQQEAPDLRSSVENICLSSERNWNDQAEAVVGEHETEVIVTLNSGRTFHWTRPHPEGLSYPYDPKLLAVWLTNLDRTCLVLELGHRSSDAPKADYIVLEMGEDGLTELPLPELGQDVYTLPGAEITGRPDDMLWALRLPIRMGTEERHMVLTGEEDTGLAFTLRPSPDLAWFLMREDDNYPYENGHMSSQLLLEHEGEGCTLALALVDSGPHIAGNGNLMLGLWDQAAQDWSGPIYTVGGDVGEFSSWTDEEGALHVLCANTMIYQGDEGGYNVGHFRFDGKTLTELGQWYDELDRKLVPAEGGMEVYEINPQYRLQQYNPEYNGVPLPEKWLYSHFEPVT